MSTKSSSTINYIYSIIYQTLLVLTPLLTAPYIARVLGAEGVGVFSYTYNIANYFALFAMLGLNNYGNRKIAQIRDQKDILDYTFSSIYYLQVIMGVLFCLLYLSYVALFVQENLYICLIQTLPVAATIINITWFFWGLEQFKITVKRSIAVKLLTLVCIYIFVKAESDVWKYILILALGTCVGNIPLITLRPKFAKLKKVHWHDIFVHLKPNLVLFVPIISVTIYRTVDKVMLGWLIDYKNVGYYENADRIINVFLGFITVLGQVMLPKVANMVANGKNEQSNRLIQKSVLFSTLFCSAIVFGILGIASLFIPVFLGDDFYKSINILMMLAPNLFLLAWGNVLKTQYLIPRGKDKEYVLATLLGVVTNVILNIILIPRLMGVGAAIGTISAELISLVFIVHVVRDEIPFGELLKQSIGYFVAGIIMMIVLRIMVQMLEINLLSLILCILTGAAVFILESLVMLKRKDVIVTQIKNVFVAAVKRLLKRRRSTEES